MMAGSVRAFGLPSHFLLSSSSTFAFPQRTSCPCNHENNWQCLPEFEHAAGAIAVDFSCPGKFELG